MINIKATLSVKQKYEMRKVGHMTDIMRGWHYDNMQLSSGRVMGRLVGETVSLIHCQNYEKYASIVKKTVGLLAVLIDGKLAGLMQGEYYLGIKSQHYSGKNVIYQFVPTENFEYLNEQKLCDLINEGIGLDKEKNIKVEAEFYCLTDEEKQEWTMKQKEVYFDKHLQFDDDFIAYLWRSRNDRITIEELKKYRDTIYSNRSTYTQKQMEMIAKEIVFYLLPQLKNGVGIEDTIAKQLCLFVMEAYGISFDGQAGSEENIRQLKELFLINTIEKAKEYYINNNCSTARYKDFGIAVDYCEIMDSFDQWDISESIDEWRKEAVESWFDAEDVYKDWNLARILDVLEESTEGEEGLLKEETYIRLREYIQQNKVEIYVRDVLIYQIKQLMKKVEQDKSGSDILAQCCELLEGFEYRELTMDEKEMLRKNQNMKSLPSGKFYNIYKREKIFILKGWSRFTQPRQPGEPRYEPSPDPTAPFIYLIYGEDGLIGKMEVAEHHIIWNVIGYDKERIILLFTQYVRNLEMISPDTEVRFATPEENDKWDKKTGDSKHPLVNEWWILTGRTLDSGVMGEVIKDIRRHIDEVDEWKVAECVAEGLVFYALPIIEKNPSICSEEDIQFLGESLEKITYKKYHEHIQSVELTARGLIDTYEKYYLINDIEEVKKIYVSCCYKKTKTFKDSFWLHEKMLESYEQFDITPYEKEWAQEVFDCEITESKLVSRAAFLLDLLENYIGTRENYKVFVEEFSDIYDKEYLLYRVRKIMSSMKDEYIYNLLDKFCQKIEKEINAKEQNQSQNQSEKNLVYLVVIITAIIAFFIANRLGVRSRYVLYTIVGIEAMIFMGTKWIVQRIKELLDR